MRGGDGVPWLAAGADFPPLFSFFARFSPCFHENLIDYRFSIAFRLCTLCVPKPQTSEAKAMDRER